MYTKYYQDVILLTKFDNNLFSSYKCFYWIVFFTTNVQGDSGMKGSFASRLSGSADLYKVNSGNLTWYIHCDICNFSFPKT